jgi:hypothetical protein
MPGVYGTLSGRPLEEMTGAGGSPSGRSFLRRREEALERLRRACRFLGLGSSPSGMSLCC